MWLSKHLIAALASADYNHRILVFFAHCHPHRLIIHSPTFLTRLSQSSVPSYLLNAIFANAAALSTNPLVRRNVPRESGLRFAEAALAELFDGNGKLLATGLDAAQALVFLEMHKTNYEATLMGERKMMGTNTFLMLLLNQPTDTARRHSSSLTTFVQCA